MRGDQIEEATRIKNMFGELENTLGEFISFPKIVKQPAVDSLFPQSELNGMDAIECWLSYCRIRHDVNL